MRAYLKFLPEVDHLPQDRRRHWVYLKLWPNLAFDIYPDQIDFMQFVPLSATRTMLREISYALPDARREMRASRYLNWRINRIVNVEDKDLIALCYGSADFREGLDAFLTKRKPTFTGR